MDALIFSLNAVVPIILMLALGYVLKRIGMMTEAFAKATNRLVFHVFLPVMLFLNVYRIEDFRAVDFGYILYVLAGVLLVFLLTIPLVMRVTKLSARRGVLLQAAFRSNYALIGIPLAQSLFGEEGAMVATLLSAVSIPTFNILAVISLSLFTAEGKRPSVKGILLNILKNPLIQGIAAGLAALGLRALFVRWGISFRLTDMKPLYTVMGYLSDLATPLALLSLGAQFEFSAVAKMKREIVTGTLLRTVIVPLIGVGGAYLFFADHFSGAHFAAFVAVFATPVAVSSVPMTQEMGSDAILAGQLVIWTTIVSAFTIFLISFLLRLAGIF